MDNERTMIADLIDEFFAAISTLVEQREQSPSKRAEVHTVYLTKVSSLRNVESEINNQLENLVFDPCRKDATLWILAAQIHPSSIYIPSLCKILANDKECIWHEGIVEVFEQLKDPQTIPCLEAALNHKLNYDPGWVVAIRILDTLAEIGTSDAIKIIERCLDSPHIEIRDEAVLLMEDFQ